MNHVLPIELCFRHRSALLLLLVPPVILAAAGPPSAPWEVALGLALLASGAALRLWAARRIGKRARVRVARAPVLVTSGPYARVRNPLYVANGAALVGLGLVAGGLPLGAWLLASVALVYTLVVAHEEGQLAAALGRPYLEYCARVPRWAPWPGRRAVTAPADTWPWTHVLRREAGLAWLPVAAAAVLLAQGGQLPLAAWLDAPARLVGVGAGAGAPLLVWGAVALAALANAATTEAKLRRHRAFRGQGVVSPAAAPAPRT